MHDGLIGWLPALVQGNADTVVHDLAEATELLVGEVAALSELMWGHVAATIELGDTDPSVVTAALLPGAVADLSVLEGVSELEDFGIVMERLLERVDGSPSA